MITRDVLASQIRNYLQHRITRAALVDWAEHAMMEEAFDDRDLDAVRSPRRAHSESTARGRTSLR